MYLFLHKIVMNMIVPCRGMCQHRSSQAGGDERSSRIPGTTTADELRAVEYRQAPSAPAPRLCAAAATLIHVHHDRYRGMRVSLRRPVHGCIVHRPVHECIVHRPEIQALQLHRSTEAPLPCSVSRVPSPRGLSLYAWLMRDGSCRSCVVGSLCAS
jgi:hypothetical protein